jgi:MFS family permease
LQSDQRLYGLLMGAIGLGTLLGALWLGLRKRGGDPWRDMFVGLLLMGMAPAAFAALAWVPNLSLAQLLVSTACLVAGVGNGLALVQSGTLLQTLAPQAVLGRAGGVLQSIMVVGQLTGLVLVPLAVPGLVSITLFFAGATLALWLIAAGGALLRRVWSKPPAMQAFTTEGAEGALPLDKLGNREVEGGAEVPTR